MDSREIQEKLSKIRYLVGELRIQEALNELELLINRTNNFNLQNEFISLKSRYNREVSKSIIGVKDSDVEDNKINSSIIILTSKIQNLQETTKQNSSKKGRISIALLSLIIAIVVLLFGNNLIPRFLNHQSDIKKTTTDTIDVTPKPVVSPIKPIQKERIKENVTEIDTNTKEENVKENIIVQPENKEVKFFELKVVVNEDMSEATIKVNDLPAIIIDDKLLFKTIRVKEGNNKILIQNKKGKTCKKSIFIQSHNQRIMPCD